MRGLLAALAEPVEARRWTPRAVEAYKTAARRARRSGEESSVMMHGFLQALTDLPTLTRFAIALAVFLFVPRLCERLRLPSAVGLLAAGVFLGPSGVAV